MNDKIDRILEAAEYPERFTDEELDALLSDPEARDFYRMMSKTADSLTETELPDIEEEWSRFAERELTERKSLKFLQLKSIGSRYAAAAVIAIVASIAVVAATIELRRSNGKATEGSAAEATEKVLTSSASNHEEDTITLNKWEEVPVTVDFRNESLERILREIGEYYEVKVVFTSQKTKDLRLFFKWDKSQPLAEVIGQLNNFEQIKIKTDKNVITVE